MAFISLKWFAGMIPRRGRQHLPDPHATEAENCNLYSGELRPLHKPALAHRFCAPTDDCWRQPLPTDPSIIPDPPPEPPQCVPVQVVGLTLVTELPDPVQAGVPLTLQVDTNGDATTPIQYQWYKNNIALPSQVDSILYYPLLPEDSYGTFSVLVQNPCGQELSEPYTIGEVVGAEVCRYYECDALTTAISSASPWAYFPMLDGDAGTSGTGWNTGDLLLDRSGNGNDFTMKSNGTAFNSTAAGLLDTCVGETAFYADAANAEMEDNEFWTKWPKTGDGSFVALFNKNTTVQTIGGWLNFDAGSGGGYIRIQGSGEYLYAATSSQGVGGVGKVFSTATNLPMAPQGEGNFVVVTWKALGAGAEGTTIKIFGVGGKCYEETQTGYPIGDEWTAGGSELFSNVAVTFGDNTASHQAIMGYAMTDEQALGLVNAYAQNKSTYVDPNPGCIPVTCKVYQCDAMFNFLDSNSDLYWDYTLGGPVPTAGVNDTHQSTGAVDVTVTCSPLGIANNTPEYPSGVGTCTGFDWAWFGGGNNHESGSVNVPLGPVSGGFTIGMVVRGDGGGAPAFSMKTTDLFHPSNNEFSFTIIEQTNDYVFTHYGREVRTPFVSGYHVLIMTYWRDPQWTVWSGSGAQETSIITGYLDGVSVGSTTNARTTDVGNITDVTITGDSGSLITCWFDGTIWSQKKINAFQDEFNRNFSDYVDPNPDCRLP